MPSVTVAVAVPLLLLAFAVGLLVLGGGLRAIEVVAALLQGLLEDLVGLIPDETTITRDGLEVLQGHALEPEVFGTLALLDDPDGAEGRDVVCSLAVLVLEELLDGLCEELDALRGLLPLLGGTRGARGLA